MQVQCPVALSYSGVDLVRIVAVALREAADLVDRAELYYATGVEFPRWVA
jgi:hypothetical protein